MDYGIFCLEVTQNADHCQFFQFVSILVNFLLIICY